MSDSDIFIILISITLVLLFCIPMFTWMSLRPTLNKLAYNNPSWSGVFSLILNDGSRVLMTKENISDSVVCFLENEVEVVGVVLHNVPEGKMPRVYLKSTTDLGSIKIQDEVLLEYVTYTFNSVDNIQIWFHTDVPVSCPNAYIADKVTKKEDYYFYSIHISRPSRSLS